MANPTSVMRAVTLVFPSQLYDQLMRHLFPGDLNEHGAVVLAGHSRVGNELRLTVREIVPAIDGVDYCTGTNGHRALQASFIHRQITRCRDEGLSYLAVHNHAGHGHVAFSQVDMQSHERGYPALLDIARGNPVGALVVAQEALEVDVWTQSKERLSLSYAISVGESLSRFYPDQTEADKTQSQHKMLDSSFYDRQEMLLGARGQHLLRNASVAIVGLGGVGSIVSEQLARLGVGKLTLIDPDRIEHSNFSRIVGATVHHLKAKSLKTDIAARVAREANPSINLRLLTEDFSSESAALTTTHVDYIFLAADTMRARLSFNAIVHQYHVPGVQIGSKVTIDPESGLLRAAFSVVREVLPGAGCLLCNQLIDPTKLAEEYKTGQELADQQYGTTLPNPSVITLNAVSASHAVNNFFLWFIGLRELEHRYLRFDHLSGKTITEIPRKDEQCSECSPAARSRFGMADAVPLPCSTD